MSSFSRSTGRSESGPARTTNSSGSRARGRAHIEQQEITMDDNLGTLEVRENGNRVWEVDTSGDEVGSSSSSEDNAGSSSGDSSDSDSNRRGRPGSRRHTGSSAQRQPRGNTGRGTTRNRRRDLGSRSTRPRVFGVQNPGRIQRRREPRVTVGPRSVSVVRQTVGGNDILDCSSGTPTLIRGNTPAPNSRSNSTRSSPSSSWNSSGPRYQRAPDAAYAANVPARAMNTASRALRQGLQGLRALENLPQMIDRAVANGNVRVVNYSETITYTSSGHLASSSTTIVTGGNYPQVDLSFMNRPGWPFN